MEYSFKEFINQFNIMSQSSDPDLRAKAARYTYEFQSVKQAWIISRELLLQSTDPQFQYLGAQILYNKIKLEFATLNAEAQEELRKFVYETLLEAFVKYPKLVFNQLCAAAALIGIFNMPTTWPTFIDDILKFAQKNDSTLVAAIQIFESIDHEIRVALIEERFKIEIKNKFADESKRIIELFLIVLKNSNSEQLVERTLFAIHSCVEMQLKLQLLENSEAIDVLLKAITVEKYFKITTDILIEAITNSNVGDVLSTSRLSQAMALIPQATKTSVMKIIEFAAVNSAETYLKQLNAQDSLFCVKIAELITAVGVRFNIFILENNDYSKVILKLLVMCVSHRNRKVSYFAFDFWTSFRSIIAVEAQDLVKNLDCSFITAAYMDVLNLLLENCKRATLTTIKDASGKGKKLKVIDLDGEDEDNDGFDKEEEDDVTRMTLRDYRSHADDVFFSIYDVMSKLHGEEGIKQVLTKIVNLLDQQNMPQKGTPEFINYATNCEVAILAINGMLDGMDVQSKMNPYACELIKIVLKLPEEEIIISATLQFLYECNNQLQFAGKETTLDAFRYILNNVVKSGLAYLAAQTFLAIAEVSKTSLDLETLKFIANFMGTHFSDIKDMRVFDSMLQGIFALSWELQPETVRIELQKKAFEVVETKFNKVTSSLTQENLGTLQTREDVTKIGLMLESLYKSLDQHEKKEYKLFYETTVLEFVKKHLPYYLKYIQLFSNSSVHGHNILQVFSRILKLILRICDTDLAPSYNDFMSCVLSIFEANPAKNSYMLGTMSFLIFVFAELPQQQEWIKNKFADFNVFVLKAFAQNNDPDLIKHFVGVQMKVFEKYMDYYLNMPQFSDLIDSMFEILQKITEYSMLREILSFLYMIFGSPAIRESKPTLQKIPALIKCLFAVFPDLVTTLLNKVANILSSLIKELSTEAADIYKMCYEAMNLQKYNIVVDDAMKETFLKTVFLCTNDILSLKLVLSCLHSIVNFNASKESIVEIQMIYQKKIAGQN